MLRLNSSFMVFTNLLTYFIYLSIFDFSRQGFSVGLGPVLELPPGEMA